MSGDSEISKEERARAARSLSSDALGRNNVGLVDFSRLSVTTDLSALSTTSADYYTQNNLVLSHELDLDSLRDGQPAFTQDTNVSLAFIRQGLTRFVEQMPNQSANLEDILSRDRGQNLYKALPYIDQDTLDGVIGHHRDVDGYYSDLAFLGTDDSGALRNQGFSANKSEDMNALTLLIIQVLHRDGEISPEQLKAYEDALNQPASELRDLNRSTTDIRPGALQSAMDEYKLRLDASVEEINHGTFWDDELPSGRVNLAYDHPEAFKDFLHASALDTDRLIEQTRDFIQDFGMDGFPVARHDTYGQILENSGTFNDLLKRLDLLERRAPITAQSVWRQVDADLLDGFANTPANINFINERFATMRSEASTLPTGKEFSADNPRQERMDQIDAMEAHYHTLVDKINQTVALNNDITPLRQVMRHEESLMAYIKENFPRLNLEDESGVQNTESIVNPRIFAALSLMQEEHEPGLIEATGGYGADRLMGLYARHMSEADTLASKELINGYAIQERQFLLARETTDAPAPADEVTPELEEAEQAFLRQSAQTAQENGTPLPAAAQDLMGLIGLTHQTMGEAEAAGMNASRVKEVFDAQIDNIALANINQTGANYLMEMVRLTNGGVIPDEVQQAIDDAMNMEALLEEAKQHGPGHPSFLRAMTAFQMATNIEMVDANGEYVPMMDENGHPVPAPAFMFIGASGLDDEETIQSRQETMMAVADLGAYAQHYSVLRPEIQQAATNGWTGLDVVAASEVNDNTQSSDRSDLPFNQVAPGQTDSEPTTEPDGDLAHTAPAAAPNPNGPATS